MGKMTACFSAGIIWPTELQLSPPFGLSFCFLSFFLDFILFCCFIPVSDIYLFIYFPVVCHHLFEISFSGQSSLCSGMDFPDCLDFIRTVYAKQHKAE